MSSTPRPRKTKQRHVILEELRKVTSHPSADELYNMVRRRLPHISMGTVYRNLELLVQKGTIQSLDITGTQKRFDANASSHYHIRCLECGRVEDAHIKRLIAIQNVIKEVTDFEIVGHRLELVGLCPRCKARARVLPLDTVSETQGKSSDSIAGSGTKEARKRRRLAVRGKMGRTLSNKAGVEEE